MPALPGSQSDETKRQGRIGLGVNDKRALAGLVLRLAC